MAIMKYTKFLFKAVKKTDQKRDSGLSGPSDMGNKFHRINSCPGSHDRALLLAENADSNNKPIPTITVNDDEAPLVPSYSASSDPFVDKPDNVPLLDLSNLRSNATALRTAIDAQVQEQTHLQIPTNQPHAFRVIIVGGGPNGLILAHALHQAGIDYIVLERSQNITTQDNNDGTGLVLWPNSARILDQLGLLRPVHKLACSMRARRTYLADGTPYSSSCEDVFARSQSDLGRSCMLISHTALVGLLWEALPERDEHVQTGKEVVSIETHVTGVRVTCADGSVEEGSLVVGCDGVHSVVRRSVCGLRAEKKAEARRRLSLGHLGSRGTSGNGKTDKTMEAKYYGLVGSAPLLDGLEPGVCYETRGDATGKTFHVYAGKDTAYFLVYIRLDRPTHKRASYTAQNAEYLASALAQHPLTDKIKFGDLWQARRCGKMVDFHEGIAEKWYHERVVLAGDAAHSMMPSLGLGVNTGFQGVAELTNNLRRLLFLHPHSSNTGSGGGGQGPDTATIKRISKEYQNNHDDMARRAALISSYYTRAIAHQGQGQRTALDSFYGWATPPLSGDIALLERQAAWAVRLGITLDFLEEKHFREGKLKWASPRRRVGAASASAAAERMGRTVWVHPGIPVRVRAT